MKFLFVILLILAAIYGGTAQASEWVEYHEFIKADNARQGFIPYNNPPLTREEMMVKRAIEHKQPETQIASSKEYIFKDKESANQRFNDLVEDKEMRLAVNHIKEMKAYGKTESK